MNGITDKKGNFLTHGGKFTEIYLNEPLDECIVCGLTLPLRLADGLPVYEGYILPPDWSGEWAGFTACPQCYHLFSDISEPLEIYKAQKMLQIFLSIIFRKRDKNGF